MSDKKVSVQKNRINNKEAAHSLHNQLMFAQFQKMLKEDPRKKLEIEQAMNANRPSEPLEKSSKIAEKKKARASLGPMFTFSNPTKIKKPRRNSLEPYISDFDKSFVSDVEMDFNSSEEKIDVSGGSDTLDYSGDSDCLDQSVNSDILKESPDISNYKELPEFDEMEDFSDLSSNEKSL
jgi:hypothetical protein